MKKEIKYCPFMEARHNFLFAFFAIFGFGTFGRKHEECLRDNCEIWNRNAGMCSFRLMGNHLVKEGDANVD